MTRRAKIYGLIGVDVGHRAVKVAQLVRRGARLEIGAAAVAAATDQTQSATYGNLKATGASLTAAAHTEATWQSESRSTDAWAAEARADEAWADEAWADDRYGDVDLIRAAADICERLSGRCAAATLSMGRCELHLLDGTPNGRGREGLARWGRLETAATQRLSELSVDGWLAGAGGEKETPRTHVVGMLASDADAIVDDLASLGWRCEAIDAVPWAVARAAALDDRFDVDAGGLCLDWGDASTTLTLARRGRPLFARELKAPSAGEVVRRVADELKMHRGEAERLVAKLARGDAAVSPLAGALVERAVCEAATTVAREITRTAAFWKSALLGEEVRDLFVMGAGALLPYAIDRLRTTWGAPVESWTMRVAADFVGRPPACALLAPAVGLSALAWEEP
ncbi:MAG: hypothetical protein KDA61_22385 [Planctomycetales bacterium]|nr:hypothetical protein [Planctomycetales bacterium]